MDNRLLKIIMLLTGSLLLCVPTTNAQDDKDKADLFLYEGHRQKLLGNHADAFELFSHSLRLNPESASALSHMFQYYQYMRNDSMAVVCLRRATELDPDNYWLKESLAGLLTKTGETDEAITVLEAMSVQFPNNENVLLMLEELYDRNMDYGNVIRILDRLEVKEGKSEQLSMEKFRIYKQLHDYDNAYKEMTDLAVQYPNDPRYKVLTGDLLVEQGRLDDGLAVYREVERENPDNVYLMASMLNYYDITQQDSLYNLQVEKICLTPGLDDDTRLRFLSSLAMQTAQDGSEPRHLIDIFKKVLAMRQTDTRIGELCARFMVTVKSPVDEIRPVLRQMLSIDPECDMARELLMSYAVDDNDTLQIIDLCRPMVECSSDNIAYYYYLGIAYFMADSADLAVKTLDKGLAKVNDDTNLQVVANMYSIIGDAYHKLKDNRHAYEYYDSCLMYNPDNALVLNNYAYYLSLENKNLDKAEEMIRRSLETEEGKNTPTYLDTYAWILFRQGKYTEAKVYIDSALVLIGDSLTDDNHDIIEHAGDIYSKNGLTDEAVAYWQQSLDMGNPSVTLQKKLKKRKYVEGKKDDYR